MKNFFGLFLFSFSIFFSPLARNVAAANHGKAKQGAKANNKKKTVAQKKKEAEQRKKAQERLRLNASVGRGGEKRKSAIEAARKKRLEDRIENRGIRNALVKQRN